MDYLYILNTLLIFLGYDEDKEKFEQLYDQVSVALSKIDTSVREQIELYIKIKSIKKLYLKYYLLYLTRESDNCFHLKKMKRKQMVRRSHEVTTSTSIAGDQKAVTLKAKSKPKTQQKCKTTSRSSAAALSSLILNTNVLNKSLSSTTMMMTLKPNFFRVDALELAPRLLGKYLRKDDVVLQITEVYILLPPLLLLNLSLFSHFNLGIAFRCCVCVSSGRSL